MSPSLSAAWPMSLALLLSLAACGDKEEPTVDEPELVDADGDGSPEGQDCDDADEDIHPGAAELCNEVDDDCDGLVDDADEVDPASASPWNSDLDGDGYGDASTEVFACEAPEGFVADGEDCDDTDSSINPAATEICDAADTDEDCDGVADDADASVDSTTMALWYADGDGDSYGDPATTLAACDLPAGYLADDTDCDDTDSSINPAATEICDDRLDNDCDGTPGSCRLSGDLDLSLADAMLVGEDASDFSGVAINRAGDVDGDGIGDLIVGATGDDDGGGGAGAAYLLSGPLSGTVDLSTATAKLIGTRGSAHAGKAVAGADIDQDGYSDVLVGSPDLLYSGLFDGAAFLVTGPVSGSLDLNGADLRLRGDSSYDYLGSAIDVVGDVQGDGLRGIIVGAEGDRSSGTGAGAAYLFMGVVSGTLYPTDAVAGFVADAAGDSLGSTVAGVGDTNGDGLADLLLGAPKEDSTDTSAGAAYLLLGPLTGTFAVGLSDALLWGEAASDGAGTSLSGAGDLDGDGYDDLVIGAPGNDTAGTGTGAAYLVLGPVTSDMNLSAADARLMGESVQDQAGTSVAGAGDTDGDGYHDLIIGAPGRDTYGLSSGAAYLVLGPPSGSMVLTMAQARLLGSTNLDGAGDAVAGAGDINGDGLDDLLVGAKGQDSGGVGAGATYLVLGHGF